MIQTPKGDGGPETAGSSPRGSTKSRPDVSSGLLRDDRDRAATIGSLHPLSTPTAPFASRGRVRRFPALGPQGLRRIRRGTKGVGQV